MKYLVSLFAALAVALGLAQAEPALDDLAFLEGKWVGSQGDFSYAETWHAPMGGVMAAVAQGEQTGALALLEFIIITQDESGLVMRYKHYRPDYSTWEGEAPIILPLTSLEGNDVTFSADPPSYGVQSIRYWLDDDDSMNARVIVVEDDAMREISFAFTRAE